MIHNFTTEFSARACARATNPDDATALFVAAMFPPDGGVRCVPPAIPAGLTGRAIPAGVSLDAEAAELIGRHLVDADLLDRLAKSERRLGVLNAITCNPATQEKTLLRAVGKIIRKYIKDDSNVEAVRNLHLRDDNGYGLHLRVLNTVGTITDDDVTVTVDDVSVTFTGDEWCDAIAFTPASRDDDMSALTVQAATRVLCEHRRSINPSTPMPLRDAHIAAARRAIAAHGHTVLGRGRLPAHDWLNMPDGAEFMRDCCDSDADYNNWFRESVAYQSRPAADAVQRFYTDEQRLDVIECAARNWFRTDPVNGVDLVRLAGRHHGAAGASRVADAYLKAGDISHDQWPDTCQQIIATLRNVDQPANVDSNTVQMLNSNTVQMLIGHTDSTDDVTWLLTYVAGAFEDESDRKAFWCSVLGHSTVREVITSDAGRHLCAHVPFTLDDLNALVDHRIVSDRDQIGVLADRVSIPEREAPYWFRAVGRIADAMTYRDADRLISRWVDAIQATGNITHWTNPRDVREAHHRMLAAVIPTLTGETLGEFAESDLGEWLLQYATEQQLADVDPVRFYCWDDRRKAAVLVGLPADRYDIVARFIACDVSNVTDLLNIHRHVPEGTASYGVFLAIVDHVLGYIPGDMRSGETYGDDLRGRLDVIIKHVEGRSGSEDHVAWAHRIRDRHDMWCLNGIYGPPLAGYRTAGDAADMVAEFAMTHCDGIDQISTFRELAASADPGASLGDLVNTMRAIHGLDMIEFPMPRAL